jgi:hypothetical protein
VLAAQLRRDSDPSTPNHGTYDTSASPSPYLSNPAYLRGHYCLSKGVGLLLPADRPVGMDGRGRGRPPWRSADAACCVARGRMRCCCSIQLVPSPAGRSDPAPRPLCSIARSTGQTLQRPRPTAACHRLFPSLLPPNHLASRHVPSSPGTGQSRHRPIIPCFAISHCYTLAHQWHGLCVLPFFMGMLD